MRKLSRMTAVILVLILLLSLIGCSSSADKKTHLTFQIWDVYQRPGMQAMCDAYTAKHPDVVIDVQATSWSEYWTKLEGSATSNTMPDIFWMHSNQMFKYADNGYLADCSEIIEEADYSEIAVANAKGSDGRVYGVPKDKDTIALLYNKELFDAAGVAYPTVDWTWDDLESASAQINEQTGKYGYMAFSHDQIGYWNFVCQNGGQILNEEGTEPRFTDSATAEIGRAHV